MKQHEKVLIIGIDGGTFDVIRPLVQHGELPNLTALMTAGVSAELSSAMPPITVPAWVSFMTGKNPGKHGIFNSIGNVHRTYRGNVVSATDIKANTLWSILSESEKRLILITIPNTYPPININGVMISEMGSPSDNHPLTYPPELQYELLQRINGCKVKNGRDDTSYTAQSDLQDLIQNLYGTTEKITEAALYLMKEYEWDLFMVVYILTDHFQHLFWKFMDPTHPDHDPELSERYGQVIFDG